jgi:3-oxoadipate enol-lactonase
MPLAEVNDITIYYEIHGKGDPLVLINGFGVDHADWGQMIDKLANNYEVVIFDNRGIGQSTIPLSPFTLSQMAKDVAELMEILKIEKANVFGHSMGGAIAQHLALKDPQKIKKLILCNTFAKLDLPPSLAFEAAVMLMEEGVSRTKIFLTLMPWLFSNRFLENPENLKNFIELCQSNPYPQPPLGFKRQGEALRACDSRPMLHKILHPTLVIASEFDIIAPLKNSEELKQKIPNAQLKVIPEAGHALQVEMPGHLCDLIHDFFG